MRWYQKLLKAAHHIQGHLVTITILAGTAWGVLVFAIQPRADNYIIQKINDEGFAAATTVDRLKSDVEVIQRQLNAVDNATSATRTDNDILKQKLSDLASQIEKQDERQRDDMKELRRLILQTR